MDIVTFFLALLAVVLSLIALWRVHRLANHEHTVASQESIKPLRYCSKCGLGVARYDETSLGKIVCKNCKAGNI